MHEHGFNIIIEVVGRKQKLKKFRLFSNQGFKPGITQVSGSNLDRNLFGFRIIGSIEFPYKKSGGCFLFSASAHKTNQYEPNSLGIEHYGSWPLQKQNRATF